MTPKARALGFLLPMLLHFGIATVEKDLSNDVTVGGSSGVSPNQKDYHHGSSLSTQAEAIAHHCRTEFGGQLVAPLLPAELDTLRDYVLLQNLNGILLLTAGARFQNGPWEWLYTLNSVNNLKWHPNCEPATTPSAALCFQADSDTSYGFCECDFTIQYRAVCEVESKQECGLVSDVTIEFPIYDNDTVGVTILQLLTTPEVTSINLGSDTGYFDMIFDPVSHVIRFAPRSTLAGFFDNTDDPHLSILDLQLSCPGVTRPADEIKILILDGNSSPPKFEPASGAYEIKLPFSGPPINWESYIKVMDADVLEINTALTFQTKQSDMIDLAGYPVERVPKDVELRLEYYMLYFGLNSNWNQTGSFAFEIEAMDNFGKSSIFQGQLDIGKHCGILTDDTQTFAVFENATMGESIITLDVEYVLSIDTSANGLNDKYFSFEFDQQSQKIHLKPKDTLMTYFDQEVSDHLSLVQIELLCFEVSHTIPEIKIQVEDVNDHWPSFEPTSAIYYPQLPSDGSPINLDQFVKVTDGDFKDVNTALSFSVDRSDLIFLTPGQPERVPADPSERLQYYKIYFALQSTWTQIGVHNVVISAEDGAGHQATFDLTLEIGGGCGFISDLTQPFIISELTGMGEVAVILEVRGGVTDIDTSVDPINDKYFSFELDTAAQKIYLKAKETLKNYFDFEDSQYFEIRQLNLTCSSDTFHEEPVIRLMIQDENDRSPEFDPVTATYEVKLPFVGAPINWHQFVKIMDTDFLETNTALTFTLNRDDLILFTPAYPERVPTDLDSRLEYYKLYFDMNVTWTQVGSHDVVVRAMDAAGNFKDFPITLLLTDGGM